MQDVIHTQEEPPVDDKASKETPNKAEKTDKKSKKRRERLEFFVNHIPGVQEVKCVYTLLSFLLPFLKTVMEENVFRYMLGMISVHCLIPVKKLARCAKVSNKTVRKGKREFKSGVLPDFTRQRVKGAGRKRVLTEAMRKEILKYVQLRSYGPCTKDVQEYTAATLDSIQAFLRKKFHEDVARSTIQAFLKEEGIRLRTNKKLLYGNQKKETGAQKVIRHSQFENIYQLLALIDDPDYIVLSIDAKKKEVLGQLKASGKCYTINGKQVVVFDHDYIEPLVIGTLKGMDDLLDRMEGKAIPFGIYDHKMKKLYMAVGISHDTPEFIARTILRFIDRIKADHPEATKLVILCDGGGSNGSRCHVFKKYIEEVSTKIGMPITIGHYPPHRSKFNLIERRCFAPLSKKFERTILYNLRTVLAIINNLTTKTGLTCIGELDTNVYEIGNKITDAQYNAINITYITSPNGVDTRLTYTIDGTGKKTELLDHKPLTVFEIKHNIDLSKAEKEEKTRQKAAEKEARAAEKAAKAAEKAAKQVAKASKPGRPKRSATSAPMADIDTATSRPA